MFFLGDRFAGTLHDPLRWHFPGHSTSSMVLGSILNEPSLKTTQAVGPMLSAQDTGLRSLQVRHLSNPEFAFGLARRIHSLGNEGGKQMGLVRQELEVPGQDTARKDVRRSLRSRGSCFLGRNAIGPQTVGLLQ